MAWPLALALTLAAAWAGPPESTPSDATVIYYNARMALREGNPTEATKLWLLRNAVENQTGRVSPYDHDFRSVTWAALGALGLCQDGFARDEEGAGLWPVALHNTIVRNLGRHPARRSRPFDAFEVDRQSRFVTLHDVLGARELGAVDLSKGRCLRARVALVQAGEAWTADLGDRHVAARLLRFLLARARGTLDADRVMGRSVLEARLFDLDLQITALAARDARIQARKANQDGRLVGLNPSSLSALGAEAPTTTLDPDSQAAATLRDCVHWPVREWMLLSPDRRLYLYDTARAYQRDAASFETLGLGILDQLIARGEGAEAARWISRVTPADADPEVGWRQRASIWAGERGQRLLALDTASGFRERAVIAAERGVDQLSRGDLSAALRSMAFARRYAGESQGAGALEGLTLRWLTYIAARFELTDALLTTLAELVPGRDYSAILENLLWSAAYHADLRSFETGLAHQRGRGALERRLAWLRPLVRGDTRRFTTQVQGGLAESRAETLRFLVQFVTRLELEDADVRAGQLPVLGVLRDLLEPVAASDEGRSGLVAGELASRTLAIEEGLQGLPAGASALERARALSPGGEVFVGNVRLAPTDPLPWPFRTAEVLAPPVFTPIDLVPEEWRDAQGDPVLGWSIRG